MGQITNVCSILVGKSEQERPLGTHIDGRIKLK
jgi:hypothetical protein